jgi:hypothetical protein
MAPSFEAHGPLRWEKFPPKKEKIFTHGGNFWPNFPPMGPFLAKFSPDREKFSFFPLILTKFSNCPPPLAPPWKMSGYGLAGGNTIKMSMC